MEHKRWWAAAGAALALAAVVLGLSVATGCLPVASACPGQYLGVHDPQDATPWGAGTLEEVAPGQDVALVGHGFAACDDTGGELCSQNGQVHGPRDVAFVWRQVGHPDVTMAEGRIEDGGSFAVGATVPDDASTGPGRVVLVRDGDETVHTVVQVTD